MADVIQSITEAENPNFQKIAKLDLESSVWVKL